MCLRLHGGGAGAASHVHDFDVAGAPVSIEVVAWCEACLPLLIQPNADATSYVVSGGPGAPLRSVGNSRRPAACCRTDLFEEVVEAHRRLRRAVLTASSSFVRPFPCEMCVTNRSRSMAAPTKRNRSEEPDKQRFRGDPHDLIVFDEGTDFLEFKYLSLS